VKRIILLVSLASALVPATLPFAGASYGKGQGITTHQVSGVLDGTLEFVPFPSAASPYDVDSLGHASGVVKGLGRTNIFTFHRPLPDGSGDVVDGRFKIVAANHDTIQGQYVGTTVWGQEPDQLIGIKKLVITGGTGQYTNASGTIHATAYITFMGFGVYEWPGTWALEGMIYY
jgi:hypothetical protein